MLFNSRPINVLPLNGPGGQTLVVEPPILPPRRRRITLELWERGTQWLRGVKRDE